MIKRILLALLLLSLLPIASQANRPVLAQDGGDAPEPYTTGVFPRAMAFDGSQVWIANWVDNTITILNAETGEYVRTLEGEEFVGEQPVALAWDGTHMWVANYQDNTVYRLQPNGEVETIFGASNGIQRPIALMFDGAHMWIVNQGTGARPGTVIKVVAATVQPLGTYDVGYFPTDAALVNDEVWVTNGFDDSVTILDAISGGRVGQVNVSSFPFSIVFDGLHVWVSHYDGTIMLVNNGTREIDEDVTLEEVPGRPIDLLYAFERVWVTNVDDESIADFQALNGILVDTETTGAFPASLVATDTEIWAANWLDYKISTFNAEDALSDTVNPAEVVATNIAVLLPSPVPTATPTPVPIQDCNPNAPSRLRPGDRGRIDAEGDTTDLRMRREVNGEVIDSYPVLTEFIVLEGPVCDDDNNAWYRVRLIEGSQEGWFIEAIQSGGAWDYTIEPDTLEGDE